VGGFPNEENGPLIGPLPVARTKLSTKLPAARDELLTKLPPSNITDLQVSSPHTM